MTLKVEYNSDGDTERNDIEDNIVDIFKKHDLTSDPDFMINVAALLSGIDRVLIGITKTIKGYNSLLKKRGVKNLAILENGYWKTDTEKAMDACQKLGLKCITDA
jgi:hypothetical protein